MAKFQQLSQFAVDLILWHGKSEKLKFKDKIGSVDDCFSVIHVNF